MAIEKLNTMAAKPVYKDKVVFFTVNCDECVFCHLPAVQQCERARSSLKDIVSLLVVRCTFALADFALLPGSLQPGVGQGDR